MNKRRDDSAWDEFIEWHKTGKKTFEKITALIAAALTTPIVWFTKSKTTPSQLKLAEVITD